ncbi:Uu.00g139050.m01.CDS01 [Anthostomella pinea]|uniref:RING-type E3 ubiquitin transferase n=1 Tax=Anthostomella pinea TaxID=933095 RepID=A0AAI8VQL2_9PEZI|nr:Uu.00g139050.m01.CDS01 [Anthostomella pinea]
MEERATRLGNRDEPAKRLYQYALVGKAGGVAALLVGSSLPSQLPTTDRDPVGLLVCSDIFTLSPRPMTLSMDSDSDDIQSRVLQSTLAEVATRHTPGVNGDPDEKSEAWCVICLDSITEPCEARPCHHSHFDYLCLISWLERSSKCPLCKGPVHEVLHDFGHDGSGTSRTYPVPQVADVIQQARPISRHQPSRPGDREHAIRQQDRVRQRPGTDDEAILRRQQVYRDQLYSLHVGSNPRSRYREITPALFESEPEMVSRARTWLRRELRVFEFLGTPSSAQGSGDVMTRRRANNAEFLLEYVIAILKTVDIQGSQGQAIDMLVGFIGRENSTLLLHELRNFLRSPLSLEAWDREDLESTVSKLGDITTGAIKDLSDLVRSMSLDVFTINDTQQQQSAECKRETQELKKKVTAILSELEYQKLQDKAATPKEVQPRSLNDLGLSPISSRTRRRRVQGNAPTPREVEPKKVKITAVPYIGKFNTQYKAAAAPKANESKKMKITANSKRKDLDHLDGEIDLEVGRGEAKKPRLSSGQGIRHLVDTFDSFPFQHRHVYFPDSYDRHRTGNSVANHYPLPAPINRNPLLHPYDYRPQLNPSNTDPARNAGLHVPASDYQPLRYLTTMRRTGGFGVREYHSRPEHGQDHPTHDSNCLPQEPDLQRDSEATYDALPSEKDEPEHLQLDPEETENDVFPEDD